MPSKLDKIIDEQEKRQAAVEAGLAERLPRGWISQASQRSTPAPALTKVRATIDGRTVTIDRSRVRPELLARWDQLARLLDELDKALAARETREHPMLFTPALARKLATGSKTVTRRPFADLVGSDGQCRIQPGDRIWVREAWRSLEPVKPGAKVSIAYKAGGSNRTVVVPKGTSELEATEKFRPSLHMPRFAARTILVVESVTRETLGPLSIAEAGSEGCASPSAFEVAWNTAYREKGLSTDTRPEVWRISFRSA